MRKKKKEEAKKDIDILLEVAGEKMWGQYIEMSHIIPREEKILDEMMDKMAQGIVDAALLSGYRPVKGSQRYQIANGWTTNTKTVAARLRGALSATPTQFMAFCGFKMHEASVKMLDAEHRAREAQERLNRVLDILRTRKSLREVQKDINAFFDVGEDYS